MRWWGIVLNSEYRFSDSEGDMMVGRGQEERRGGEGVGMDMWGGVCVVKGREW